MAGSPRKDARDALAHRLRLAYSGELGAARGYAGHWRSLRRHLGQRADVQRIQREELEHRAHVGRLAVQAGRPDFTEGLLAMAEVEWDHERFFHDQVRSHWLHRRLGSWQDPPPRKEIRASFRRGDPAVKRLTASAASRPSPA